MEDEYRSTVWVEDLAVRVMDLARSPQIGIRHVTATQAISRVELANYLLNRLGLDLNFDRESRHQRSVPHIGRVELASVYTGGLSTPLSSVLHDHRAIPARNLS